MAYFRRRSYNYLYPLQIWCVTLLVGTSLHLITTTTAHVEHQSSPFFEELATGVYYSIFTLIMGYGVFFWVAQREMNYKLVKLITGINGILCCSLTLMFKFNFWITDLGNKEYASLVASYCLPLLVASFIIRLKNSNSGL